MAVKGSRVTICVVPRERFSCAVDSLRNIAGNTAGEFDLLYIDGNSPAVVASRVENICREQGYTYVRREEYLSPNQARNIALQLVETPYVVFADNDLFVYPGWLQALVECADETGAWAVTPTILEGGDKPRVIHMAGGIYREEVKDGYNSFRQRHRFILKLLSDVQDELVREPVDFFEFHCVLLRTDVFSQRQFLDEEFLSHREHLDVSREVRKAGGQVWFEPGSLVRYDNARAFEPYDREYFELRWSPEWCQRSRERSREKWGLAPDDSSLVRLEAWAARHRKLMNQSHTPWTLRILPLLARRKTGEFLRRHKLRRPDELK